MNNPPKIAVIVPAYNVERFIDKCLSSICGQTFTDLEIIVVDDGSTDKTPSKCDEWADRDPRIQVIHQHNGGLSDARNTGLSHSTAPLISFIDSDDFLELNMYEQLYGDLIAHEADIAVCNAFIDHQDGHSEFLFDHFKEGLYRNPEASYLLIMGKRFKDYVWCHLFRRELWDDIWFPKRRGYEDIAVMHLIYARAHRIHVCKKALHHYVMHGSNYVLKANIRSDLDYIRHKNERCRHVHSSDLFSARQKALMTVHLCKDCIYPLRQILHHKDCAQHTEEINAAQDFINQVLTIPIPKSWFNIRHLPRYIIVLNHLIAMVGYHRS